MEGCHWLKTRNNSIRCSSVNKIIKNKRCGQNASSLKLKKNKSMNLASMGISSPVFISDSLFAYYKKLWGKCKKLWQNKYIHGFWFWVSWGLIRVKVSESSPPVKLHMLIWRTSLQETDCRKIIRRTEITLGNYRS